METVRTRSPFSFGCGPTVAGAGCLSGAFFLQSRNVAARLSLARVAAGPRIRKYSLYTEGLERLRRRQACRVPFIWAQ